VGCFCVCTPVEVCTFAPTPVEGEQIAVTFVTESQLLEQLVID